MRRYITVAVAASVLVLLAFVGNLSTKVRIERESHEKTRKALAIEKKNIKVSTRIVKVPVLLPNGVVSFRTETSILSETEINSILEITEKEKSKKEITEKPALKRWKLKVAQEVNYNLTLGRQWYGAGFRQSLVIVEVSAWAMFSTNAGMIGLDVDL